MTTEHARMERLLRQRSIHHRYPRKTKKALRKRVKWSIFWCGPRRVTLVMLNSGQQIAKMFGGAE